MQIAAVPLTPDNLPLCVELWSDRATYLGSELTRALESGAKLLRQGRAQGAIVFEGNRPRAFGLGVFVQEEFIDAYLAAPRPQLGKQLLLRGATAADDAVLSIPDIGQRNARSGLQLVVLNTSYDLKAGDPDAVLGELIRAFMETYRGYRLARIVNEVFGHSAAVIEEGDTFDVVARWDEVAPGTKLRGLLTTLTRERAAVRRSPLLPMFVYNPPRVLFTAAERELLKAALSGCTDEALSNRLGIELSAVKARWLRIVRRANDRVPEIFRECEPTSPGNVRGSQKRHLIVEYVRANPSELKPYMADSRDNRLLSLND